MSSLAFLFFVRRGVQRPAVAAAAAAAKGGLERATELPFPPVPASALAPVSPLAAPALVLATPVLNAVFTRWGPVVDMSSLPKLWDSRPNGAGASAACCNVLPACSVSARSAGVATVPWVWERVRERVRVHVRERVRVSTPACARAHVSAVLAMTRQIRSKYCKIQTVSLHSYMEV